MRYLPFLFILFIMAASPACASDPLVAGPGAPPAAAAHNDEGVKALTKGSPADAEMHFREAVKLDPKFARAHYNLGLALHAQGKHGPASDSFRKALDLDPADPEIRDSGTLKMHVSM